MESVDTKINKENDSKKLTPRFDLSNFPQTTDLSTVLSAMFPEQNYEDKKVQKAKAILGSTYSTEDIKALIASFEYLIGKWSVEYERSIFNNMTLKELLQTR